MIKELKNLFIILFILIFFYLISNFYFSDENKKNSYRSLNNIDQKNLNFSKKLKLLRNDTKNIVFYVENTIDKNKKNYNFWNLINKND
jgi:flagellar biogenesis protein FliO